MPYSQRIGDRRLGRRRGAETLSDVRSRALRNSLATHFSYPLGISASTLDVYCPNSFSSSASISCPPQTISRVGIPCSAALLLARQHLRVMYSVL